MCLNCLLIYKLRVFYLANKSIYLSNNYRNENNLMPKCVTLFCFRTNWNKHTHCVFDNNTIVFILLL